MALAQALLAMRTQARRLAVQAVEEVLAGPVRNLALQVSLQDRLHQSLHQLGNAPIISKI